MADTTVATPFHGDASPIGSLPTDVLIQIWVMVADVPKLSSVCRRWRHELSYPHVRERVDRWISYSKKLRTPRALISSTDPCHGSVLALATDCDGTLYSGGTDKLIRVWSTATWQHIRTIAGHTDTVKSLAAHPDRTIYSASADVTICLWSGIDGSLIRTLRPEHPSVALVATESRLFATSPGGIHCWSHLNGDHLCVLDSDSATNLVMGPDNTLCWLGSKKIKIWGPRAPGSLGMVTALCFHEARSLAVSTSGIVFAGYAPGHFGERGVIRSVFDPCFPELGWLDPGVEVTCLWHLVIGDNGDLIGGHGDSRMFVWRGCANDRSRKTEKKSGDCLLEFSHLRMKFRSLHSSRGRTYVGSGDGKIWVFD
eukprot:m.34257 g.34257  ORF g.34257 m.34257 type:complete len:369 (-) comp7305_c0_seq1:97-1203(-)